MTLAGAAFSNDTTTVSPTSSMKTQVSDEFQLSNSDIIVIAVNVLIFTLGTTGNLLVIRYFGFYCKSKHPYNTLLIHLAFTDLMSSMLTPIQSIYLLLSSNKWGLGSTLCTLINIIAPLTVNVSAWLLGGIAFERYRGIVSPLKPRFSKTKINFSAAVIWILSIITLIPYIHALGLKGNQCVPAYSNKLYELLSAVMTLVLQSIIPIVFMIFTVSRIFNTLQNRLCVQSPTGGNASFRKRSRSPTNRSCVSASPCLDRYNSSRLNRKASMISTSKGTILYANKDLRRGSLNNYASEALKEQNSMSLAPQPTWILTASAKQSSSTDEEITRPINNPQRLPFLPSNRKSAVNSRNSYTNFQHLRPNLSNFRTQFSSVPELSVNNLQGVRNTAFPPKTEHEFNTYARKADSVNSFNNVGSPCIESKRSSNGRSLVEKSILDKTLSAQIQQADEVAGEYRPKSYSLNMCNERKKSNIPSHSTDPSSCDFPKKKFSSTYRKVRNFLLTERTRHTTPTRKQRQIIVMLSVTFFVFVVCSLPYNVFYVLAIIIINYQQDYRQLQTLGQVNVWLSMLVVANSIMNCFIYAGMNREFRRNCAELFVFDKEKKRRESSITFHYSRTSINRRTPVKHEKSNLLTQKDSFAV